MSIKIFCPFAVDSLIHLILCFTDYVCSKHAMSLHPSILNVNLCAMKDKTASPQVDQRPTEDKAAINPEVALRPTEDKADGNPEVDLRLTEDKAAINPEVALRPTEDKADGNPEVDLRLTEDKAAINPEVELHPTEDKAAINPEVDLRHTEDKAAINPEVDLRQTEDKAAINPEVDLRLTEDNAAINPEVDLRQTEDKAAINPEVDLRQTEDKAAINPEVDLRPTEDKADGNPEVDLRPTEDKADGNPVVDLRQTEDKAAINPEVDLRLTEDKAAINPEVDIRQTEDKAANNPEVDFRPTEDKAAINPEVDLRQTEDKAAINPEVALRQTEDKAAINPEIDLRQTEDKAAINPDVDLHPTEDKAAINPEVALRPTDDKEQDNIKEPVGRPNSCTGFNKVTIENNRVGKIKFDEMNQIHYRPEPSSVCAIMRQESNKVTCCAGTGFIIAQGLMISNYHVIVKFINLHNNFIEQNKTSSCPSRARLVQIEENLDLRHLRSKPVACFCLAFLKQNDPEKESERLTMCFELGKIRAFQKDQNDERNLDYVIVETEKIPNYSNFEPVAPTFAYLEMNTNENMQQVQVLGLKIDYEEDIIEKVIEEFRDLINISDTDEDVTNPESGLAELVKHEPARVKYHSELRDGSSGSPVFDNQGRIIAINTKGIFYEDRYAYSQATMMLSIFQHAHRQFPSLRHIFPDCVTSFPNIIPGPD